MAIGTFTLLRLQYIKEYGRCRSKERREIAKGARRSLFDFTCQTPVATFIGAFFIEKRYI